MGFSQYVHQAPTQCWKQIPDAAGYDPVMGPRHTHKHPNHKEKRVTNVHAVCQGNTKVGRNSRETSRNRASLHPVSDMDWRFNSYMIVYMLEFPFSQIIPPSPSPSPSESKSTLYTSVSFFLSCIQGRHCHLPKFHIYVLVYCIGVFLSGLLHSV